MPGCIFFGKRISGPFTIPSGIAMTQAQAIERLAREIPELGILTTKSIGPEPKEGNKDPIIAQYDEQGLSFVNAVGLANPGSEAFAAQLSIISLPPDRFLLASIFGSTPDEISKVTRDLSPHADGFELNVSCPHSRRYGQVCGQDPSLVNALTEAAAKEGKPVLVKLSPNLEPELVVQAALKGGAAGFVAINTKGPIRLEHDGFPVLSNTVGGISGKAILPAGVAYVKRLRQLTELPIIACGGISSAEDVQAYKEAGAQFFGVGSALAGMSTQQAKAYFSAFSQDLAQGTATAKAFLHESTMQYEKFVISENEQLAPDLSLLTLDHGFSIRPGQFVFVWLPGAGEKPYAVFDDQPCKILVQKRGLVSGRLSDLKPKDDLYLRGPYGNPVEPKGTAILVAGGSGIAAMALFLKRYPDCVAFFGGRTKEHLSCVEHIKTRCRMHLATDSGEVGFKGLVTQLLAKELPSLKPGLCLNAGPEPMIREAIRIEQRSLPPERILSSVEFRTMCGNGLCGRCATSKGLRSCVDGTFLNPDAL
ncbi:MAG: dihydroorotate dehydrogenase [Nanoarchaeota archaeon]